MGYAETFDHTADLGLRIRGADLDDLFRTAAEALFDVMVANRHELICRESESILLSAESPTELLVDWLNELIYRVETGHRLYGRFDLAVDGDGRELRATIFGEAIDPSRHVLDHEVKATTRHGVKCEREGGGWLAEVILDI